MGSIKCYSGSVFISQGGSITVCVVYFLVVLALFDVECVWGTVFLVFISHFNR